MFGETPSIITLIKGCQQTYNTTWTMTDLAYAMLAAASKGHPGVAKYILNKIDPKPGQSITDQDILLIAPLTIEPDNEEYLEWYYEEQNPKGAIYGYPEDDVFKR